MGGGEATFVVVVGGIGVTEERMGVLDRGGATGAVGVGTGEGWAEEETEMARACGWWKVGTGPV